MDLGSQADLKQLGFAGFSTVSELRTSLSVIPAEPGVYSIVWNGLDVPQFLDTGTGGWFKGINPNVSVLTLTAKWVPSSSIIYIGKASGGLTGKRGLRKRLTEYLRFGEGLPVGHNGGRYIWQIKGSDELLVCWKPVTTSPEALETELLRNFVSKHSRLPFANLRH